MFNIHAYPDNIHVHWYYSTDIHVYAVYIYVYTDDINVYAIQPISIPFERMGSTLLRFSGFWLRFPSLNGGIVGWPIRSTCVLWSTAAPSWINRFNRPVYGRLVVVSWPWMYRRYSYVGIHVFTAYIHVYTADIPVYEKEATTSEWIDYFKW
jgi:hypothetical protein